MPFVLCTQGIFAGFLEISIIRVFLWSPASSHSQKGWETSRFLPSFLSLSWPTGLECSSPLSIFRCIIFRKVCMSQHTTGAYFTAYKAYTWQPNRGATYCVWPSPASPTYNKYSPHPRHRQDPRLRSWKTSASRVQLSGNLGWSMPVLLQPYMPPAHPFITGIMTYLLPQSHPTWCLWWKPITSHRFSFQPDNSLVFSFPSWLATQQRNSP